VVKPGDVVSSLVIHQMIVLGSTIGLEANSIALAAHCLACGAVSTRLHGRYVRRPIGLP
jgi:hypothetical protein